MPNPLPDDIAETMKMVGAVVDEAISGAAGRRMGFALIVFDFGEGGNMSFVSNAHRKDFAKMLKEMVEKLEGEVN